MLRGCESLLYYTILYNRFPKKSIICQNAFVRFITQPHTAASREKEKQRISDIFDKIAFFRQTLSKNQICALHIMQEDTEKLHGVYGINGEKITKKQRSIAQNRSRNERGCLHCLRFPNRQNAFYPRSKGEKPLPFRDQDIRGRCKAFAGCGERRISPCMPDICQTALPLRRRACGREVSQRRQRCC